MIIAVNYQFKQLERRRSLKKIRASTGFEPVTSAKVTGSRMSPWRNRLARLLLTERLVVQAQPGTVCFVSITNILTTVMTHIVLDKSADVCTLTRRLYSYHCDDAYVLLPDVCTLTTVVTHIVLDKSTDVCTLIENDMRHNSGKSTDVW